MKCLASLVGLCETLSLPLRVQLTHDAQLLAFCRSIHGFGTGQCSITGVGHWRSTSRSVFSLEYHPHLRARAPAQERVQHGMQTTVEVAVSQSGRCLYGMSHLPVKGSSVEVKAGVSNSNLAFFSVLTPQLQQNSVPRVQ